MNKERTPVQIASVRRKVFNWRGLIISVGCAWLVLQWWGSWAAIAFIAYGLYKWWEGMTFMKATVNNILSLLDPAVVDKAINDHNEAADNANKE